MLNPISSSSTVSRKAKGNERVTYVVVESVPLSSDVAFLAATEGCATRTDALPTGTIPNISDAAPTRTSS